jgi:hypothetical protein
MARRKKASSGTVPDKKKPSKEATTAAQLQLPPQLPCEIIPTSDMLYQHRDVATKRVVQTFYQSVQIPIQAPKPTSTSSPASATATTVLLHNVVMGDLCAVQCGAGFKMPPFEHARWKVAQILTLFMETPSSPVGATGAEVGSSKKEYFAHVRWMAHYKQEGNNLLSKQERQSLNLKFRTDQMLLETLELQKIALSDILPAAVCVQAYETFGAKDGVPPEPVMDLQADLETQNGQDSGNRNRKPRRSHNNSLDSCWKVFFFCSRRVDATAGAHIQRDWVDYCDQIRPTTRLTTADPPSALARGWKDFRNQAAKVSVVASDWTDDHLRRLTEALEKGYSNQQLQQPDRFQLISNNSVNKSLSGSQEEEEDAMEVQDDAPDDDDDRVNKENARRNRSSKSRKKPTRTASKKQPTATAAATLTSSRPAARRVSVLKTTTLSKTAAPTTKKRPSKEAATSTRGKTNKSNKKRRVSLDDDKDSVAVHAGESDQESDSLSIVPISNSVYVPKQSRKNNSKNEMDPQLRYLEGVELDVDPSRCDPKARSHLASRWQVQVGDLIAVGCDDASEPAKSPVDGKRNIWYPFSIPWTPAQVLAVYHDGDDYMMELRWMYRPADLDAEVLENMSEDIHRDLFEDGVLSRRMIVEFDEHVDESPIEAALGRIVATSESSPSSLWLDTFKSKDGVPQVPLVCKYFAEINDSSITRVDDWTDYGESPASIGPMGRGILCPKSRLEKDPKLRKFYAKIVRSRYGFEGEFKELPDYAPPPTPDRKIVISWPADMLDEASVRVPLDTENVLYKYDGPAGISREFFKSVQVPVVAKRCASRVTGNKSTRSDNLWGLQVGDVICLANNKAKKVSSTSNPWYPYLGPWCFCQVLAIYRDAMDNVPSSQPLLEVRHFYRLADLPIHVKTWKPGSDDSKKEEVYETEVVESGIPASRVLGRVDLFLGHFEEISNMKANSNDDAIPVASCRCRYFYDASFERLQPIFCARTRPAQWFHRMLERGFKASKSINDHAELGAGIEFSLGVGLGSPSDGIADIFQDMLQAESKPVEKTLFAHEQESGPQLEYLLSSSLQPPWACYAQHDSICSVRDRKDLWWTVKVGDVVAMRINEISASQDHSWYPFRKPWRPCQILAMYRERGSATEERWLVQVRWFIRQRELPNTPEHSLVVPGLEPLYETDVLSVEPLDNSMLLGPIALFSNSGAKASATVWKAVDPFLPVAPFVYSGSYVGEKHHHAGIPSDHSKMLHPIIKRGIDICSHYSDKEKETVLAALDVHDLKCEESGASEDDGAWMTLPPFHVDHATSTEYYTELNLRPPYSEYATNPPAAQTENSPVWTVRLGDVVVVRYGNRSLGKTLYPHPADKGGLNFPMQKPWAVGEVVTIMKASDSTDLSGMQQPPDDPSSGEDPENVSLEIRWFYKKGELPGSSRDESSRSRTGDECEEIFETDHYGKAFPSNLLAPAVLHPTGRPILAGRVELGMPVLEFCCSQYYSVYGQSNLACGGLDGRVERGRLHSSYFGKDAALKKALDHIRSTGSTLALGNMHAISSSWKEAFNRVIDKLALTDASKEAYENRSALIGREEEKQEILSFLEAAISGESTDNKASIFIAGPPGTGKR